MIGEFAKNHFTGQKGFKRLNCAQTIIEIFKNKFDFISDDTVKKFKKMGYGKAPGGECGMLFAAKYIYENTGNDEKKIEIQDYFNGIAGTTLCSELKKKKIPFCADCIDKVAHFVDKSYLDKDH